MADLAAGELANIMGGFGVDILAIQETKLTATEAEGMRKTLTMHQLYSKFSCAQTTEGPQQKGVAILLSRRLQDHLVGSCEVVTGPTAEETDGREQPQALGTGIRLRLAFRNSPELQAIAVYMPHQATNPEAWTHTQTVVTQWIHSAQSQGQGGLVMGDLNERINEGGRLSDLGRLLYNSRWIAEAHRSLHGTLGGETSPARAGAQQSRIDFLFASTHRGSRFRQATVVQQQTELQEDHRLIVAEWAVRFGWRGTAQPMRTARPLLNIASATEEKRRNLKEALEAMEAPAEEMDKQIWDLACQHLGTVSARRAKAQQGCRLSRAGKQRLVLHHRIGGGPTRWAQWLAAVEECHQILAPEGIPQAVRDRCVLLMAEADRTPSWVQQQQSLTNLLTKRLSAYRKREAACRLFHKITEAVGHRALLMEKNLGAMVRALRQGPMLRQISRVVTQEAGATRVYTEAGEVESLASDHFDRHFTYPTEEPLEVAGRWSEEYMPQTELAAEYFAPITRQELDSWMARSPWKKAPGPSGVMFELLRLTGERFRDRLLEAYNYNKRLTSETTLNLKQSKQAEETIKK
ncbi:hypothetical protein H4R20_002648 [Coemansia guatemalensis]|uniref:Endonuclease/exonuclease/phosphatase domain-containing protein n=1 Tax=Coemansia guatemalensis TaxID=2761395 RepID=A0A9W8I3F2_9FUNG|nr:hypothetical protein H4R20_002648 [Coemansia guatemalensis]